MSRPEGGDAGATRVGVLHGPNLDQLGRRDPDRYGTATLSEIDDLLRGRAERRGVEVISFQSSGEGRLIDWIHEHADGVDGWVVNAGGLTHTSVALRDALVASGRPFVEVHLSQVFGREEYRRRSLLADAAVGLVAGFREQSYVLGLEGLLSHLPADDA